MNERNKPTCTFFSLPRSGSLCLFSKFLFSITFSLYILRKNSIHMEKKVSFVGIMYRRESSSFFLRNFYSKEAAITWWFAAATWLERQFYHQLIFFAAYIHFLRTQIQEYILVQFIVFLHAERVKYKGELEWWTRVARWYEVLKRPALELLLLLKPAIALTFI